MKKALYIVLSIVLFLSACSVSKEIDPRKSGFNAEEFRFEDYPGSDLTGLFQAMFPPGTKKEYVDHVLIDVGGAISGVGAAFAAGSKNVDGHKTLVWEKYPEGITYNYKNQNLNIFGWSWTVSAVYDASGQLQKIQAGGSSISPL